MTMLDRSIIDALYEAFDGQGKLAVFLALNKPHTLSNWKQRGIPARWRPTMWALLEQRCPQTAAKIERDVFLDVRITGDAA